MRYEAPPFLDDHNAGPGLGGVCHVSRGRVSIRPEGNVLAHFDITSV
jgi:hypothetical protein